MLRIWHFDSLVHFKSIKYYPLRILDHVIIVVNFLHCKIWRILFDLIHVFLNFTRLFAWRFFIQWSVSWYVESSAPAPLIIKFLASINISCSGNTFGQVSHVSISSVE